MSSRLAQLAARLDALSRNHGPVDNSLRIARWGYGLAIPLPEAVVEALALREGDVIEVRMPDQRSLNITVRGKDEDARAGQPA
ncbi:MAG: hypothetical protein WDO12_02330 [Pseudomonadota bacterium]